MHVLSGPDHVAAIAPLAVGGQQGAWRTGFRWGLGHSSGVLLVGGLSLALRGLLPIEMLSFWAERLVGVALIAIGLWGLRRALTCRIHSHEHLHDGERHVHIHLHSKGTADTDHGNALGKSHAHTHAAFAVGSLHGLAGSSHFLGVVPALAFATHWQSLCYLVAYGMGTVLAMTLFSSAIGWLAGGCERAGARGCQLLMVGCSSLTLCLGAVWLV